MHLPGARLTREHYLSDAHLLFLRPAPNLMREIESHCPMYMLHVPVGLPDEKFFAVDGRERIQPLFGNLRRPLEQDGDRP